MYKSLLAFPWRYVELERVPAEERTELKAWEYSLLPDNAGITFAIEFPNQGNARQELEDHFLSPDFSLNVTDSTGQRVGNFHPVAVDYEPTVGQETGRGIATVTGTFTA